MQYLFRAIFEDGYEYCQPTDDSSRFGLATAWGDLLHLCAGTEWRRLQRFGLLSGMDNIWIGMFCDEYLQPGQFQRNGQLLTVPAFPELSAVKQIMPEYYRTRCFEISQQGISLGGDITAFNIGYTVTLFDRQVTRQLLSVPVAVCAAV